MSKTARTDGQWQVDCDLNGVPICIGQPLSLPRYDLPTLDEVRVQCAPLVSAIKPEWRTGHVCRHVDTRSTKPRKEKA